MTVARAFYIKLGRGGLWETDSIAHGLLRIGWDEQSLDDVNVGRWDVIEKQMRVEAKPMGVATNDLDRLNGRSAASEAGRS